MEVNAKLCKDLGSNSPGSDASDRFSSGRAPTTPIIAETIFGIKGIVCMSRTIAVFDISIIMGTLIFVWDEN